MQIRIAGIRAGAAMVTALLSGCGDGGGGQGHAETACSAIGGGAASVTTPVNSSCGTNCSTDNPAASVDADFSSFAHMKMGGIQAEGSLRGNAQDGLAFPAGVIAGVLLTEPRITQGGSAQIQLATYLDGILQEDLPAYAWSVPDGVDYCSYCYRLADGRVFVGIPATRPFDSIGMTLNQTSNSSTSARIYEFCYRADDRPDPV